MAAELFPGRFPDALTPADCCLTDFEFMPLVIDRLQKSRAWLICKRRPELAFHMINLWMAAWKETPAASLEDDDEILADRAMCPPERWADIKQDVLRGFVTCVDGRLYHELIAIKALEAWLEKLGQRISSGHGNAARYKGKFDDTHLREQVTQASAMLFALDPNSRYFTKRTGAAALGQTKKAPRPRKEKPRKPAPAGDSAGGVPTGVPTGDDRESAGIASKGNESKGDIGGKPPITPSAAAPAGADPGGMQAGATPGTTPAPTAPPKAAGGRSTAIDMADKHLVVPEWLAPHAEAWRAYEQMRWKKNTQAPYTLAAQRRMLAKLEQFFNDGEDLTEILWKSANSGWTDVYAKSEGRPAFAKPQVPAGKHTAAAAGVFRRRGEVIDVGSR